jgi:multiple sugar transport system permease protein
MATLSSTAGTRPDIRRVQRGRPQSYRNRHGLRYTFVGIAIVAVMLFPFYWMFNVSLQHSGSAVGTPWLPLHITLNGYTTALHQQWRFLITSLEIAMGSVVFSLLVAAPGAYALAHFRIRGAGLVLLAVLISQMIPGIVLANALYTAYNDVGLLNTVWGLILADSTAGAPFALLILRAFMRSIPREVIEAAYVDGAGRVRTFISIVLPLSRNALVSAGLFTFLFAWSDFLFALTLTTSNRARPVTLGIYTYISAYVHDWSTVMATAVLASLPALALLIWAQRYIAAGTTAGALK